MNKSFDSLEIYSVDLASRSLGLMIFEITSFAVLQFMTITGNALTMYIIWKAPKLRSTSNYFIACLAISDLGMGILSEHLLLATLIVSRWPFNEAVCQYQGIVAITMAAASTQTLAWTALNRYFKIVKTKYYTKVFTKWKLIAILSFTWISSILANCPYLLAGYKFVFHPGKFFCYLTLDVTWFTAFLVSIYVGIPSAVIVFCYFKVFQTVRRHNSNISKTRATGVLSVEELKVTRTLFLIVVVFMGCWTPILIMDLIDTVRGRWSLSRSAYAAYTFLGTMSSAVNPLIYAFGNHAFKEEYRKVLNFSWGSVRKMFCWVRNGAHVGSVRSLAIEQPRHVDVNKNISIKVQKVNDIKEVCHGQQEKLSVELNL
uniref:Melatonin receptor type 1B-like n=1 Tax=Actinia tenebrosa TaxID=6105 RepID=A0A6P8IYB1_ACTTE